MKKSILFPERAVREERLRRVSLRTKKLGRRKIGWIRRGILEEARFKFGMESM